MEAEERLIAFDLAGSENRATGFAFFDKKAICTGIVKRDEEILALIRARRARFVGLDAPLSLPFGRRSLEHRDKNHFRECDLQLRQLGIRFFPITLGPMRMLTTRGLRLKTMLRELGCEVWELFPGASLDILGVKRKSPDEVNAFLSSLGLVCRAKSVDESDAAIGLFTMLLHVLGLAEWLKGRDGAILVPKPGLKKAIISQRLRSHLQGNRASPEEI